MATLNEWNQIIKWKVWAQSPEDYGEQGVIVTEADEEAPSDDVEFEAINDPAKTGIMIRDLESAQKWASEIYYLAGDVVAVEIF